MKYIGIKFVDAVPVSAADAEKKGYRTSGNTGYGYEVTYKDGYKSWSPKSVFDEAYTSVEDAHMSFGSAISALENGYCIQREGWNGKGMFVVKQIPAKIEGLIIDKIQSLPQSCKDLLKERDGVPHIDYTNQMLIINPSGRADSWVPSSSDVFAKDWRIVK